MAGERRVIVGLGDTGMSFARYLHANQLSFTVADDNPALHSREALKELCGIVDVQSITPQLLCQADEIFVSPGVPLAHPAIRQAVAQGVTVHGDVEMFGNLARAPVVAITGTNGKSTVAQLVYELVSAQRDHVELAGNIGTPCLDVLSDDVTCYVLELSSYQLELATALPAEIAVLLNLSPDHLDRYDTLADYYQTKLGIYAEAKALVLNRNLGVALPHLQADRVSSFGLGEAVSSSDFGVSFVSGERWLMQGDNPLMRSSELRITGDHNLENVLASLAVGHLLGLDTASMLESVRLFGGLPHRAETIAEINGVVYINDSKATNPGAMAAAVTGIANGRNVHLIAGGDAKSLSFDDCVEQVLPALKSVSVIGVDPRELMAAFAATEPVACSDMAAAVNRASGQAVAGDVVLLAPGCASFDQYRNYKARGEDYRSQIERLKR